MSGLAGLSARLDYTNDRLQHHFERTRVSFAPYSEATRRLPPLQFLIFTVDASAAEVFFRLGRCKQAAEIWRGIQREDPLDVNVAKNIAVSETPSSEIRRPLESWRQYLELLYFYDIAADSPRSRAAERTEFHQAFGDSYAPTIFFEELDNDWRNRLDPRAVAAFLSSPGRVRNFIEHKLLEFLNQQLQCSSPLLVLGVSREDTKETRQKAAEKMRGFAEQACSKLPERVSGPFVQVVARALEESLALCEESSRLLRSKDTAYANEQDRHVRAIANFGSLKFKILKAVEEPKVYAYLSNIDFLNELTRLDDVPLNLSERFLKTAAGSISGIKLEAETLVELMNIATQNCVAALMKYLISEDVDEDDKRCRDRQYRKLIDQWVKRPGLLPYLDLVESPHHCLPRCVLEELKQDKLTGATADALKKWVQRYPALSGIVQIAARSMADDNRPLEAVDLLIRGAEHAFRDESRNSLLVASLNVACQAALERDYPLLDLLHLLDRFDHNTVLAKNLINLYVFFSKETKKDPGAVKMRAAVHRWGERAAQAAADWSSESDEGDDPPITSEQVVEVIEFCDNAVVQIAILTTMKGDKPEPAEIVTAMSAVIHQCPEIADTYHSRMFAYMNMAGQESQKAKPNRGTLIKLLQRACADAEQVLKLTHDKEMRENACKIIEQARPHL